MLFGNGCKVTSYLQLLLSLLEKGLILIVLLSGIVRTCLEQNSPHAVAVIHGDGRTSLQFRRTDSAVNEEKMFSIKDADVIQLERKGNTYTASMARFGDPFTSEKIEGLELGDDVYVGLF